MLKVVLLVFALTPSGELLYKPDLYSFNSVKACESFKKGVEKQGVPWEQPVAFWNAQCVELDMSDYYT